MDAPHFIIWCLVAMMVTFLASALVFTFLESFATSHGFRTLRIGIGVFFGLSLSCCLCLIVKQGVRAHYATLGLFPREEQRLATKGSVLLETPSDPSQTAIVRKVRIKRNNPVFFELEYTHETKDGPRIGNLLWERRLKWGTVIEVPTGRIGQWKLQLLPDSTTHYIGEMLWASGNETTGLALIPEEDL